MTDRTSEPTTPTALEDHAIEALLGAAQAREAPPESARNAARDALHAQWQSKVRQRRRWRWGLAGAAVAAGLALWLGIVQTPPHLPTPEPVARVVAGQGHWAADDATNTDQAVSVGDAVLSALDGQLTTGDGMALEWSGGASVRLAPASQARLVGPHHLELLTGAMYVDSRDARPEHRVIVRSTAGDVRPIGTQFQVLTETEFTRILVREGRVVMEGMANTPISAGEQLSVDPTGRVHISPVSATDPAWAWVETVTPPFELDGRTMDEFLTQVARETGREVHYADLAARQLARDTHLNGRIELPPMEALATVLMTTDLEADVSPDTILVRRQGDAPNP